MYIFWIQWYIYILVMQALERVAEAVNTSCKSDLITALKSTYLGVRNVKADNSEIYMEYLLKTMHSKQVGLNKD